MVLTQRIARVAAALAVAATGLSAVAAGAASPDAKQPTGVVVGVRSGKEAAVREAVDASGLDVERRGPSGRFLVVAPASPSEMAELKDRLADEGVAAYVEPEHVVRAAYQPTDNYYPMQWALPKIGMASAWNVTRGASSVVVAVIDTGVDLDHPELVGRVDAANDYDFVDNDSVADDAHGHGTHVAGVVAAAHNGSGMVGIAPNVTILPIRALDENGVGSDANVAAAIMYAADHRADIINVSLGGPDYASVLKSAVDYARGKGAIVVAAVGNDSSAAAFYPAALPGVLGVSATDENDAFGSFSNYGPFVDVAAPGVGILSAVPGGFLFASGTSMASPHVVGALALVRSLHPEWDEAQLLDAVAGTAKDLGSWGRDDRFGHGRLHVSTALTAVGSDDTLPGLALVNSPVTGTLGESDPRDAYRLTLPKGGRLSISLVSSLPTTLTITTGSGATIASSPDQTSTARSYTAAAAGTYGIWVATGASNLNYKLSWKVQSPSTLTLSGPSTAAWNTPATVKGTLKRPGGTPLVKARVVVQARRYGGTWEQVATRWTSATGAYSASVKPTMRTDYRVLFDGDNDNNPATSATIRITPKAYLTRPSTPSSPRPGVTFTSAGYLRPRHTTGARDVKLYCYRYESGKWRLRKSVYAKNLAYTSATTKYSARLSLPYRGRWRIRAWIGGDYKHASTYSSFRYVTVR